MCRGETDAVSAVIQKYARPLYAFIYRQVQHQADAEDILQETWLRMIRHMDKFDPNYTFSSWLFQIAVNLCRDFRRFKWVRLKAFSRLTESQSHEPQTEESPEQKMAAYESTNRLQTLLNALSPKQREVIMLRCLYGFSEQEVANIVKTPKGTIKSRLHHAIEKLKSLLETKHVERNPIMPDR